MPVAGRDKRKAKRVVGRRAAAVGVPNQVRRIAGIAAGCKGRKSDAVEILIGDFTCGLPLDKRDIEVTWGGKGQGGRGKAEDACEELHGGDVGLREAAM